MEAPRNWIVLATATIALMTGIISLVTSIVSLNKTVNTSTELEAMKNCRGEVAIVIDSPADGDQVPTQVDVRGTSSVHENCRYVFLFVHDISAAGTGWKVADLVQVNTTGRWAGKVRLAQFPLGSELEIDARISAQPRTYVVGQILSVPPEQGVPSNIIRVRRVQ